MAWPTGNEGIASKTLANIAPLQHTGENIDSHSTIQGKLKNKESQVNFPLLFGKLFTKALALAISICLISLSPVVASSNTIPSHSMNCSKFARTPQQIAHTARIKFLQKEWTRVNPCKVIYDGRKIPGFFILKDEIARDVGGSYGERPIVGQYGDFFKTASNIVIYTLNSKEGRFVNGPAPKIKWSNLEEYIRQAGVSQGISYWAGGFWSMPGNEWQARPDAHYQGPSRKWIIPDGVIVIKSHGKKLSAGYEVRGTKYLIRSDWYFYG